MDSILLGDLAGTIGDALIDAAIPFALTISRDVTTGGDPFDPGSGTTVTTDYSCQGFVDTFSAFDVANSLVLAGDVRIIVVATTLDMPSPPSPGDRVTANGKTYSVLNVSADPALATYTLQARL